MVIARLKVRKAGRTKGIGGIYDDSTSLFDIKKSLV